MVHRDYAGHGIGAKLVAWAAERGRRENAEVVRLDCVAANVGLCGYCLHQGFTRVVTKELPARWGTAALFERQI
jgi:GNAT superfamily N-acetyltransferase